MARPDIDYTGQVVDGWKIEEYIGGSSYNITCTKCGFKRTVKGYYIGKHEIPKCTVCPKEPKVKKVYEKADNKRQSDYTGMQAGEWNIGEYVGKNNYEATCRKCGYKREITGYFIKVGQIPRCPTCKGGIDLTDTYVGQWHVLKRVSEGRQARWLCECSCGTRREVLQYTLVQKTSLGCGHNTNHAFEDLTGKQFWDWHVDRYNKEEAKWECTCKCGKTKRLLSGYQLKSGASKSCGHDTTGFKDLTGQVFNEWTVIRRARTYPLYSGPVLWLCRCSCGTEDVLSGYQLRAGVSKSCGCKSNEIRIETCLERYGVEHSGQIGTKRTQEQLELIKSRDNLIDIIEKNFSGKPSILELSEVLGISRGSTKYTICKYGIEKYVQFGLGHASGYEKLLAGMYPCEHTSDKTVLNGQELDLYYPEHNMAVEFNGNYWHSELKKEKEYHRNKSLGCYKKGVRLIHIFEYEWNNAETRRKICNLLSSIIYGDRIEHHGARECEVAKLNNKVADDFIEKYHLQGKAQAVVSYGLVRDGDVLGVMTFGRPRFSKEYACELIRLAWKENVVVAGGAEKLFKAFIDEFKPDNIVSYCDISKFTGKVYERLGFENTGLTEIGYKWVDPETNNVMTRYETMKSKLVENGLGTESETEVGIMHRLGYLRVFDCGNIRYVWKKK